MIPCYYYYYWNIIISRSKDMCEDDSSMFRKKENDMWLMKRDWYGLQPLTLSTYTYNRKYIGKIFIRIEQTNKVRYLLDTYLKSIKAQRQVFYSKTFHYHLSINFRNKINKNILISLISQTGICHGTFEIVPQEVLWSIWGSHKKLWSLPLPNVTWHFGTWPYTMTPSIDQTLHLFAN